MGNDPLSLPKEEILKWCIAKGTREGEVATPAGKPKRVGRKKMQRGEKEDIQPRRQVDKSAEYGQQGTRELKNRRPPPTGRRWKKIWQDRLPKGRDPERALSVQTSWNEDKSSHAARTGAHSKSHRRWAIG